VKSGEERWREVEGHHARLHERRVLLRQSARGWGFRVSANPLGTNPQSKGVGERWERWKKMDVEIG
jgi:hypothetical protein